MSSDLDRDMEGGRVRRVGQALEPDDAPPLSQVISVVKELVSTLPARAGGYAAFPLGGGAPVSPSGGAGGPGLTFANANNVSFGTMGNAVVTAIAQIEILAGGSTIDLSRVSFAGGNGVSFGISGSTITASFAGGTGGGSVNFSAGTTSGNLTAVTFQNGNGVSFGLNAGTITASVATAGSGSVNISAGTTSNNLTAFTLSNSNNVSFGINNSTITASVASSLTNINVSAGTTSNNLSAITFSNSNNVSFGLNGSTLTASATMASSQGSINLSAGTTSNLASAFVFSNSNGVSFGLNASTVTASVDLAAAIATAKVVSWPVDYAQVFSVTNGEVLFNRLSIPVNATLTQWMGLLSMSNTAGTAGIQSDQWTLSVGIYTMSASTASLASSMSGSFSFASGTSVDSRSFGGNSGLQYRTISGPAFNISAGDYLIAHWFSQDNTNALSSNAWSMAGAILPVIRANDINQSGWFNHGYSNSTFSTAMPVSLNVTNTNYVRTGAFQFMQFVGLASL